MHRAVRGDRSMSIHAWGMQLAMMMTTVVGANEPLSMQVSPATSFAPANLVIRTRLEPDVNNPCVGKVAGSWHSCSYTRLFVMQDWSEVVLKFMPSVARPRLSLDHNSCDEGVADDRRRAGMVRVRRFHRIHSDRR